ncbi:MAG: hypothetical protein WBM46_00770 [Polyangiales bacterium]
MAARGGVMMWRIGIGWLALAVACGSSAPEPVDPLAVDYCAACSEFAGCERLITKTLIVVCPDETRAWYSCVTVNACDTAACDTEWAAREICMGTPPAALTNPLAP